MMKSKTNHQKLDLINESCFVLLQIPVQFINFASIMANIQENQKNAKIGIDMDTERNDFQAFGEIKNECEKESTLDANVDKRPFVIEIETNPENKKVKHDPENNVKFPDEIWLKIMSYLNSQDLFQKISLVCRHFYDIHRCAAIYLEVNHVKDEKYFQDLIRVLPDCKLLKVIKIKVESSKMAYMDAIIKQVLSSCQKIKTLKLFSDQYILENTENPHLSMKTIGTLGTKLEQLELNNFKIEDNNFLSNLHELKTLTLPSYHESVEKGPKEILALFKFWPKVEAINFVDHFHCLRDTISADTLLDSILCKKVPKLKEASFTDRSTLT